MSYCKFQLELQHQENNIACVCTSQMPDINAAERFFSLEFVTKYPKVLLETVLVLMSLLDA